MSLMPHNTKGSAFVTVPRTEAVKQKVRFRKNECPRTISEVMGSIKSCQ